MHYHTQSINIEENFIMNFHIKFKFDPWYFVMLPSLSWEAVIKTVGVELAFLTDVNMIFFVKKVLQEE